MRILKTILIAVLLPVFLFANTGIAVAYHYCAGELDSVSLSPGVTCPCGEKEEKSDCCTSEVSVLKVTTDISLPSALLSPPVPVDCSILPGIFLPAPVRMAPVVTCAVSPSPPGISSGLPVLFCSLLI